MNSRTTQGHTPNQASRGYTLLEVVFVLALAAILALWGMPSIIQSLQNNQVASQSVSLLAMLNFTKSEAIRRNTSVSIVMTLHDDGWDAVVEDPNNEAEIEGCVLGQLRCTSNEGAVLTIPSLGLDAPEESISTSTEAAVEPEPEPAVTFELVFNNRGYIRGSDDAWAPETIFLQHESCSGQNQRRRVDITPTGQVSSCSLACDSTAHCQ